MTAPGPAARQTAVHEVLPAEGFEWINAVRPEDYEGFNRFDGKPRGVAWQPIAVLRVRADEHLEFEPSDFPWLGSNALVLRRRAVDALRDILAATAEVLPLQTDDGVELFVLNAQVKDALDEARSSIERLPGTDRILCVVRPAFVASVLDGADLFRLPHRGSSTYVSDRFVRSVEAAGLRGLTFRQVWAP